MISNARAQGAYWLLVAMLFAAQATYTMAGLERLWYEELAEGIRNPFWLDHRFIYDGASTNVAWYGLVLLTHKVFGFSAHAPKYLRLALHVPFLLCSAALLKRWIGVRRAWVPLLAAGLSPTLLYFNSFLYGIDTQLFAPIVWLIVRAGDRAGVGTPGTGPLQFAIGCLAMFTCLSYPTFLLYLPVLLAFHVWVNRSSSVGQLVGGLGWVATGFLTPFIAALGYVRNTREFLADPAAGGAGVFRGGGNALTFDPIEISRAISQVFQDLFVRGNSYYFALPHVEFSGLLGVAAAWGILVGALVVGWNWKPSRIPLALAGLLCLLSIAVPSLSRNLPGLRRSTGFITGLYVVLACVWATPVPAGLRGIAVWTSKLACLLLVVHHLIVYVPNVHYLSGETHKVDDPWFYRFGSPNESVRMWAREWVLKGRPLICQSLSPCRLSEIYSAVAGYLKWNGLGERAVLVTDPGSDRIIQLDIRLWQSGTFPH